jgi:hypothetical protein
VASRFHASIHNAVGSLPDSATHSLADALQHASTLSGARGSVVAAAARDAYVHAFDTTLIVATVVVVIAAGLVSWLLRPNATVPADLELEQEQEASLALETA